MGLLGWVSKWWEQRGKGDPGLSTHKPAWKSFFICKMKWPFYPGELWLRRAPVKLSPEQSCSESRDWAARGEIISDKPVTIHLSPLPNIPAHLIYSVNKMYSPEGARQRWATNQSACVGTDIYVYLVTIKKRVIKRCIEVYRNPEGHQRFQFKLLSLAQI